jgi:hypothetical protein
MKLEIVKKAYRVKDPKSYFNSLDTNYYHNPDDAHWEYVHAESREKAKLMCTEYDNYINIVAQRVKSNDIVIFEGNETRRGTVMEILTSRKALAIRIASILRFPEDELFYVQSGYSGDIIFWWGLNSCGHTTNIDKAQTYTREYVIKYLLNGKDNEKVWAASHIKQHITQTVNSEHLDYTFKS